MDRYTFWLMFLSCSAGLAISFALVWGTYAQMNEPRDRARRSAIVFGLLTLGAVIYGFVPQ